MNCKELIESKKFRFAIFALGGIIVALFIFQAGMFVGYRKAEFSYRFGDNYYRTFGGRHGFRIMMRNAPSDEDFSASHGSIGKIVKITLPTIIIEDQSGVEKIIRIGDAAIIKRFRENINPIELKVNDSVVVIGSPNDDSEIDARLVRLIPSLTAPTGDRAATTTPIAPKK